VTTSFVPWYPLAQAGQHAPAAPGVYQIRVSKGLIDYPTGKSAMVCYGTSQNLREELSRQGQERDGAAFLARHQQTSQAAELFEMIMERFRQRFGAEPEWPR
jgi:hypothetical protein